MRLLHWVLSHSTALPTSLWPTIAFPYMHDPTEHLWLSESGLYELLAVMLLLVHTQLVAPHVAASSSGQSSCLRVRIMCEGSAMCGGDGGGGSA